MYRHNPYKDVRVEIYFTACYKENLASSKPSGAGASQVLDTKYKVKSTTGHASSGIILILFLMK